MKKIVSIIVVVIVISVIVAFRFILPNYFPQKESPIPSIDIKLDSGTNITGSKIDQSDKLRTVLLSIPEYRLFYYFFSQKVPLIRKTDIKEVYFQCSMQSNCKMTVGTQMMVSFVNNFPTEKAEQILKQENLSFSLASYATKTVNGLYIANTAENSKYYDALQMSSYLTETYKEIKYANPNFTTIGDNMDTGCNCPNIDFNKSEEEETKKIYIPEWNYLYVFDKKTLKQAYQLLFEHSGINDVKFLYYSTELMDSSGKSDSYVVWGYSPSLHKVFNLSVFLPIPYSQSHVVPPEPSVKIKTVNPDDFPYWSGLPENGRRYLSIDTTLDSPILVQKAQSIKGSCEKIYITIAPLAQGDLAVVSCNENNIYWNISMSLDGKTSY